MELLEGYITPAIVVLVYCTCYLLNTGSNGKLKRFIPCIAALVGILAAFSINFPVTASEVVTTITTGMVSGLAATGVWEGYKGIKKGGSND